MTPIKPRGVVPYLSHIYRYVLPQGVWFLRRFGLKKSTLLHEILATL